MAPSEVIAKDLQFLQTIFSKAIQDFLVAVIILFIGLVIGKILGKIIEKGLKTLDFDKFIEKTADIKYSLSEMAGIIISYIIYIFTVLLALHQLNLTERAINIGAGIVLIVIIISLIIGIKEFIPNLLAGIWLHNRNYINVGDTIKIHDIEGKVKSITLFETVVKRRNDLIYIPNSYLTTAEILKIKKRRK